MPFMDLVYYSSAQHKISQSYRKTNVGERDFGKCIHESAGAKREERGKRFFDPKLIFWPTRVVVGSLSDGRPPCSESNYDDGDDEDDDD